ncbi:MAG TPA: energy transducer TonB [Longimicrobiaceae bacterium]|jgi:protein TonB
MEPFGSAVLTNGTSMRQAFEALAAEARADPDAEPVLVPGTARPRIAGDVSEMGRLLREVYPPGLRDAGITGKVRVALLVDAAGTVKYMQVTRSSGYREMDVAALRFAQALRFEPAVANGCRVPAFVPLPLDFTLAG